MTIELLGINDFYVPERMLAASYGVVMANQTADGELQKSLAIEWTITRLPAGPHATNPTNHWLARLYVEGTATFAKTFFPKVIPSGFVVKNKIPFAGGPDVETIGPDDPRGIEANKTFGMDFEKLHCWQSI